MIYNKLLSLITKVKLLKRHNQESNMPHEKKFEEGN